MLFFFKQLHSRKQNFSDKETRDEVDITVFILSKTELDITVFVLSKGIKGKLVIIEQMTCFGSW